MKQLKSLFFAVVLMLFFQTGSVFAQLGGAISLLGHAGIAAAGSGSGRESKQDKIVDKSTQQEKISGSNVMVLRVKEADIKSKAKANIIALQNRLDQYSSQYKNNQPINIPKKDSDLIAIQTIDENWPTEYYTNELKAYKRYVYQQSQKMPAAPVDSSNMIHTNPIKKDTTGAKS